MTSEFLSLMKSSERKLYWLTELDGKNDRQTMAYIG